MIMVSIRYYVAYYYQAPKRVQAIVHARLK
jgi:hypothetical protein